MDGVVIEQVDEILKKFDRIGLEDMESVKLLNRTDTKFVFSISKLPAILDDLSSTYKLVYINDLAQQPYYTVYFDTPDCGMYIAHQNGKLNRYKIRYRNYLASDLGFLEIKFKNNKGRTAKKRIRFDLKKQNIHEATDFLQENSPYSSGDIQPQSVVRYTRLTLVNLISGERVTVDYDLRVSDFDDNEKKSDLNHICIIEVKRDKSSAESIVTKTLLKHRVFTSGMSKYCIGMASINEDLKQNRFKTKLRQLEKLKN